MQQKRSPLKTMAFQSGDKRELLTESRDQNTDSRLEGVSSDLLPDSRLEMPGMLDCSSIGDHVPLIGYRWAEPQGLCPRWVSTQWEQDIYDSVAAEKMRGSHSGHWWSLSSHWHGGGAAAPASHFWTVSERQKKRSPRIQPGCPIWGDLNGTLLPFLSQCPSTGIPLIWCL